MAVAPPIKRGDVRVEIYNGIPISEVRLIAYGVVFTVMLFFITAALCFYVYTLSGTRNPKEKEHLRRLKERANDDELAKRQLERLERKKRRRRKRDKDGVVANAFVIVLCVCIFVAILSLGVLPCWCDYAKKDYVVYTGEIEVLEQMKRSRIILDDGTVVWGIGDFVEEDTYGTVVYSRRSKDFLGGEK